MRKIAVLIAAVLTAASAQTSAVGGPTPGGLATDNIEHVRHIPIAQNGVGGRLIGKYFYMNDQNKVMIFDVSDPLDPQLQGFVPMPQEWQFSREDIDGNGKILVVPNTASGINDGTAPDGDPANAVYIIDTEDKTDPKIVSKVGGAAQHTFSCVLRCKWAYGSGGNILDLRNPAKPVRAKEKWGDSLRAKSGHDVDEVKPGFVMTSTQPIQYLDVRKNPTKPKLLAMGSNDDGRYTHQTHWPRKGKDRWMLAASETTMNGRCGDNSGAFMTWDTKNWKKSKSFKMVDEYRVKNGIIADGNPVAQRNCSAHWFEPRPGWKNGGYVAAGFYDHGTRFFQVTKKGQIKEAGFFMAWAGQASAAYWITKDIVYVVDYNRGLDILKFSPPK